MTDEIIKKILDDLVAGRLDNQTAIQKLKHLSYEDIITAKIDHFRESRNSIAEVIFARGKSTEDIVAIATAMYKTKGRFLITRANAQIYEALQMPEATFYKASGAIRCSEPPKQDAGILIITAGTSDIPVAEEAEATLHFLGLIPKVLYDVGVAGIHRLFNNLDAIRSADVIIVIAGMEGALPSVIGGIAPCPVIAVPTSVGYGSSLGGLTALFAMLNSCVPGMAVQNIDNGFGSACLAYKILKTKVD